jgi:hypothetical protein
MLGPEERTRRVTLSLVVGVILLLLYALPVFVPPPPRWIVPAAADTPFLTRMFPHVPGAWVLGRLLALLVGALLVAGAIVNAVGLRRDTGIGAASPPADQSAGAG